MPALAAPWISGDREPPSSRGRLFLDLITLESTLVSVFTAFVCRVAGHGLRLVWYAVAFKMSFNGRYADTVRAALATIDRPCEFKIAFCLRSFTAGNVVSLMSNAARLFPD